MSRAEELLRLQGERDTARNRVTALEANSAELLARAERAEAELARLHQGEADHPGDPGTWPTPAQWIRRWNDMTPERRLEIAGGTVDGMQVAAVCRYQPGHEGQIAQLRAERDRLRARLAGVAIHANRARNCIFPETPVWDALADLFAALEAPGGES